MNRLFSLGVSIFLLNSLTGCTLFSFKIRSLQSVDFAEVSNTRYDSSRRNTLPLHSLIVSSNLYASNTITRLFSEIDKSADALALLVTDEKQYDEAILWKTLAKQSLDKLLIQNNEELLILNAWYYTKQMEQYFSTGAGKKLFERNQYIPIGTGRNLIIKMDALAKERLSKVNYERMKDFVINTHTPFLKPLVYRSINGSFIEKQQLRGVVIASKRDIKEIPFVDNISSSSDVEINTLGDIEGPEPDFIEPKYSFLNEEQRTNDNDIDEFSEYDPAFVKDVLGNIVSITSALPANIMNSNKLAPLAVQISQSLEPGTDEPHLLQNNANQQSKVEQAEANSPRYIEEGSMQAFIEKMFAKLWANFSNIFPNFAFYLFFGILLVFVVPFFLGYFLGKKRQDPNFTVISATDPKKTLR